MNHLTIEREGAGVLVMGMLFGHAWIRESPDYDSIRGQIVSELQTRAAAAGAPITVQLQDLDGSKHELVVAPDGAIDARVLEAAAAETSDAILPTPATSEPPAAAMTLPAFPAPPEPPAAETLAPPAPFAPAPQGSSDPQGPSEEPDASGTPIVMPFGVAVDDAASEPSAIEAPVAPPGDLARPAAPPPPAPDRGASGAGPAPSGPVPSAPEHRPTRDDLLQTQPNGQEAPATQGWRGFVRRASQGRISMAPSRAERLRRAAIASVQRSLSGPKTIVVLNPKGGAHKTTATLMIAATFGVHRGGSTLAWDNNETQGTLGARSLRAHHARTAVDLLRDVDRFNRLESARFGDLDEYVRAQGEARFDVLASDDDPTSPTIMNGDDFSVLHRTLSRFYRVMVIDTGNNPRASNWQAAVEAADQLVIVSTLRDDTASVAAGLADRLHAHGFGEKLQRSVTILSEPSEKRDQALAVRLQEHFSRITRSVALVPYEPAFVGGGVLNLQTLRPATAEAWLRACAQIAEGLNR